MKKKKKERKILENQDGGVGRHTAPPRTTRTDSESNTRGTDTKEIENKHSSRLVGGAETGTRVERGEGGGFSWSGVEGWGEKAYKCN